VSPGDSHDHFVGLDVLDASLEGKPRARAACSLATILLAQDSEVESTTIANRSECCAPWLAPNQFQASSLICKPMGIKKRQPALALRLISGRRLIASLQLA